MDSYDEIEMERLSYRAVLEASHLFWELCAWATKYRVGLVKLWLQDVPIKDAQQVIEASAGSTINEAEARIFLANFFAIFGFGGNNLFTRLSLDLLKLDWGESSPLMTKAKTKQPKHMREEWRHRLKALEHAALLQRGLPCDQPYLASRPDVSSGSSTVLEAMYAQSPLFTREQTSIARAVIAGAIRWNVGDLRACGRVPISNVARTSAINWPRALSSPPSVCCEGNGPRRSRSRARSLSAS